MYIYQHFDQRIRGRVCWGGDTEFQGPVSSAGGSPSWGQAGVFLGFSGKVFSTSCGRSSPS